MTSFKQATISRPDDLDVTRIGEYHQLLANSLFPAVNQLRQEGLIEGYDFLTHSGLDLRLWLRDDADQDRVNAVLANWRLPPADTDKPPAEQGEQLQRLLSILQHGAEQVRALIAGQEDPRTIEEAVHWLLNQFGFSNQHEESWHRKQASAWQAQNSAGQV